MSWISSVPTETLASINDWSRLLSWVLAALAAVALATDWMTGRELETRRAAEVQASRDTARQAQQEADRLRQRLAPRAIPSDRRRKMVDILRGETGEVQILYPADSEARVFAQRLSDVLVEAGWVSKMEGAMSFGPVLKTDVRVRDIVKPPARAETLRRALAIGLDAEIDIRENKSIGENDVQINVSHKPAE